MAIEIFWYRYTQTYCLRVNLKNCKPSFLKLLGKGMALKVFAVGQGYEIYQIWHKNERLLRLNYNIAKFHKIY